MRKKESDRKYYIIQWKLDTHVSNFHCNLWSFLLFQWKLDTCVSNFQCILWSFLSFFFSQPAALQNWCEQTSPIAYNYPHLQRTFDVVRRHNWNTLYVRSHIFFSCSRILVLTFTAFTDVSSSTYFALLYNLLHEDWEMSFKNYLPLSFILAILWICHNHNILSLGVEGKNPMECTLVRKFSAQCRHEKK